MVFSAIMKTLVEELVTVLSRQLDLYSRIRDLLEEEREALISKKPAEVLDLAHRKETLLLQIRVLDESRELISLRLAKKWGLKPGDVNISEIEKRCGAGADPRLGGLRDELRRCVEEIREGNAVNSRLCRNGIEIIERILESAAEESAAGSPRGSASSPAKAGGKAASAVQAYRRASRIDAGA